MLSWEFTSFYLEFVNKMSDKAAKVKKKTLNDLQNL